MDYYIHIERFNTQNAGILVGEYFRLPLLAYGTIAPTDNENLFLKRGALDCFTYEANAQCIYTAESSFDVDFIDGMYLDYDKRFTIYYEVALLETIVDERDKILFCSVSRREFKEDETIIPYFNVNLG